MWKLFLESCYMELWRWGIFRKCYKYFSNMCDEVIESYDEETKTIPTNFNEKKATCKTRNFYILLALLIAVSIYCYMMKFWAKQKHLLKFHVIRYRYKKCTYYFFSDIANVKHFDLNNVKIDETLYKNNLIY